MNCRQIDDFILNYCENKLPDDLTNQIREHINQCPFCANNEKWTRLENKILTEKAAIPSVSDDFCAKVMQQLQARDEMAAIDQRKGMKRKALHTVLSALAMTAVILLAIIMPAELQDDKIPYQVAQTNNKIINRAVSKQIPTDSKLDPVVLHDAPVMNSDSQDEVAVTSEPIIEPQMYYGDTRRDVKAGSRALSKSDMTLKFALPVDIPVPTGIPSEYHLVKRVTEDNKATYFYSSEGETPDSNISFSVSVWESEPKTGESESKTKGIVEEKEEGMNAPMSIAGIPEKDIRTMEYDGKIFTVELNVISYEEDSIKLLDSLQLSPSFEFNPKVP